MTRLLSSLAALCLGIGPVLAQETGGTITAMVDDDPRTWQIVQSAQSGDSRWQEADGQLRVRLTGREGPDAIAGAPNLKLRLQISDPRAQPRADNLSVTLARPGADDPLVATPPNSDVTLTAVQITDDTLVVTGDFTALLATEPKDGLLSDEADPTVMTNGEFQAVVRRADSAGD